MVGQVYECPEFTIATEFVAEIPFSNWIPMARRAHKGHWKNPREGQYFLGRTYENGEWKNGRYESGIRWKYRICGSWTRSYLRKCGFVNTDHRKGTSYPTITCDVKEGYGLYIRVIKELMEEQEDAMNLKPPSISRTGSKQRILARYAQLQEEIYNDD